MKSKSILKSIIITLVVVITSGILLFFIVPVITNKTKNKEEEIVTLKKNYVKYPLKKYLKNHEFELFSYFVTTEQMLNKNISFINENFNMKKIRTLFENILKNVFKIDNKKFETVLYINPKIIKNRTEIELTIKWWFVNKSNSNIIYNNNKYYDILNISFS